MDIPIETASRKQSYHMLLDDTSTDITYYFPYEYNIIIHFPYEYIIHSRFKYSFTFHMNIIFIHFSY